MPGQWIGSLCGNLIDISVWRRGVGNFGVIQPVAVCRLLEGGMVLSVQCKTLLKQMVGLNGAVWW